MFIKLPVIRIYSTKEEEKRKKEEEERFGLHA